MTFNINELKDFFLFSPSAGRAGGQSADPNARQMSLTGKGLKVTLRASHAGMRNRNWTMYAPDGMRNSCHTWVYPYQKPVQVHHDDMADPIGRIIGARYAPFEASANLSQDMVTAMRLFDAAKSDTDIVDAANLLDEAGVLDGEDWKGVGELLFDTVIMDADAAQKVLDGRYLTVSVSQHPKKALCSICHQDWVEKGQCKHERGEVDEETGKRMFLIVGDTRGTEVSFINHPADEFAGPSEIRPISIDQQAEGAEPLKDFVIKTEAFVSLELFDAEEIHTMKVDDVAPVIEPTPVVEPVIEPVVVEPVITESVKEEPVITEPDKPLDQTVAEAMKLLFTDSKFTDEDLLREHAEIEKVLAERNVKIDHPCSTCSEKDAQLKDLAVLPEKVRDLEGTLRIVRSEWQEVVASQKVMTDLNADTLVELETTLKKYVKLAELILDKDSKEEEIDSKVEALSLDSLRKSLAETDLTEAISFIRSGLVRKPEEKITISDAAPVEIKPLPTVEDATLEYAKQLVNTRKRSGFSAANEYLGQLKRRGKLEKDFSLAKAEELVAK
jgi:hypothetical protein